MGLFKEKICYKCGGKVGFLSGVSGDDFHICGNCLKQYSADSSLRLGKLKDISTKEEFDQYLEFCEKNLEELEHFQKTKSFFNFIQIDGYAEKIIFIEDYNFERKNMLKEINPPIYDLNKFLFFNVIDKDISDKKGVFNKYVRLKEKLIFGFENDWFPVAADHSVNVELPVKEGMFKDTVYMSTEAEELATYLVENASDEYRGMVAEFQVKQYELPEEFSDIKKKYFEQLQNIRKGHVMSASEMDDYLKIFIANKANRKRIAREYNL